VEGRRSRADHEDVGLVGIAGVADLARDHLQAGVAAEEPPADAIDAAKRLGAVADVDPHLGVVRHQADGCLSFARVQQLEKRVHGVNGSHAPQCTRHHSTMPSPLVRHWALDPAVTFLNHGSFGACPRAVLDVQREWQDRMEAEPVRFLARELDDHLATARAALGTFVGAHPDDLAFVTNATGAVNAVVRSLRLEPGDEILTTDHEYNAILNVLRHVAQRDGGRVVVVPLPLPAVSPDDVVGRMLAAAGDRTRLAVFSHVTSPTALVLPVERLVPALADRGIESLVDGAHAPGMVPLDLDRLGAAYYAGNLHKWVCAPKGSGFLHVRRDRQSGVQPATISHGANSPVGPRSRYRLEFDWQGTLDPTPWLAVPAALDFVGGLADGGWPAVMARSNGLTLEARDAVAAALGPGADGSPAAMTGAMTGVAMPVGGSFGGPGVADGSPRLDLDPLQVLLFDRFGIEVPIIGWPVRAAESAGPTRRVMRVSMAPYNDRDDIDRLVAALVELAAEPRA
jgi:isopenicillin-N epimerase